MKSADEIYILRYKNFKEVTILHFQSDVKDDKTLIFIFYKKFSIKIFESESFFLQKILLYHFMVEKLNY